MSNGEIFIAMIGTLNFLVLLMIYSLVKETLFVVDQPARTVEKYEELMEEKGYKTQYNESVDPVSMDAEMHDYLVRLAKEERE